MLDEVENAVGALLRAQLPAGTVIRTEPPSDTWYGEPFGDPAVGLFLHLVRESHSPGAIQGWAEERDANGRVVRRTAAERRYDLCYLVTAWAAAYEQELSLLGCVLRTVAHQPVVPSELLTGSLAQATGRLTMAVAQSDAPSVDSEIWSALGLRPRTYLDLVVTAPVAPVAVTQFTSAPETIDLSVDRTPAPAQQEPEPSRAARPKARITEGSRDGAAGRQTG